MIVQGLTGSGALGSGQAGRDAAKLQDDLNKFLHLLVTQLQNQDPLDPMDANEFTAQLVQFASVEQQIYQNANLEKLLKVQQATQVAAMVGFLGTRAEANGNVLPLEQGKAEATYTLAENVQTTTIAIRDRIGRVVFVQGGKTDAGTHSFVWNGTDNFGNAVADGAYTLEVSAAKADGSFAKARTAVFGTVTGATSDNDEVILFMGDVRIPMKDVISVNEPEKKADPRS